MPTGPRPPIPPGVARVAISGTVYTHKWVQVFYLQCTHGTVTVNDLQTIADGIKAAWDTDVKPQVPSNVVMSTVTVVFIDAVGSEVTYTGTYSVTGTSSNTPIDDASACFVVNWKISAYYRGGHPRTYLPGPSTNHVSNGSDIDSASLSSVATAMNSFRNAINALTSTNISVVVMGTLSFASGKVWRSTPVFRPFTSVSVNPKLGSQRRRIRS